MWPGSDERVRGMGAMRLSTALDRDHARGVAVLHAAFDAGITLIDPADAYCWNDGDRGHNERLIAEAVSSWNGDRSRVIVATKGGLTRPDGAWVADGRARHLAEACRASCEALGVERIALYQLHVPDPRVALATSVRALAALQRDGLIEGIGLCNVTVGQIEQARRIVSIDAVQIELSALSNAAVASGVVQHCLAHGIRVLAYRPLGGAAHARLDADPVLRTVAKRHDATPPEIALAWLADLSPLIVPLPGATRIETMRSAARGQSIALTDDDRRELDDRFAHGRIVRGGGVASTIASATVRAEVVMIMGLPGAGKTTLAETYVTDGYLRLNRDEAGGSLDALIPALEQAIAAGHTRVVLDNTYVSRKSRAPVIAAASRLGAAVRAVWLSTPIEDAQVNAVSRSVARYDTLLDPEEMKRLVKSDVSAFGPMVQFRYQRELEPPDRSEGFAQIDVLPFARRASDAVARALVIWCDGILWSSRAGHRTPSGPDDVIVPQGRVETLREHAANGCRLLGMSWQPEIADGTRSRDEAAAAIARLQSELGVAIEVEYCPHAAGPPVCWCRKPLPGLGVLFIHRHRLDPASCIYVGDGPQDPGFARRLGFQYRQASEFFAR